MSISNTGRVDLESVLNVGRRSLVSIGEKPGSFHRSQYTDTICLKREDASNSIFSINSKIVIFGELQLLCSIFERYTSNILFYEDSPSETYPSFPSISSKPSFSTPFEEDELDDDDDEGPPIISTIRQSSISSSKGSTSPKQGPASPTRGSNSPTLASESSRQRRTLSSISRRHTTSSVGSEYSGQNLEGKRYGCIELPNMTMIEILEILLRFGVELVGVSSDYDKNILHQSFVFSTIRKRSKTREQYLSRSISSNC
ncbi:unnamed protein product [Rotaria sordida]|uniref:Uncharacterized protein n=1 Tax=Rotaria sordida TaxID=392033 RepID=A0A814GUH5_9BILA|nr:unnamed protein product [Rotaria sordida]CAF1000784.1 unnamed protein product [Rotaria sordida]